MSQRDDWKDTGKGLGSAFKGLGKSIIRTAKTGVDKAADWAEGKPDGASAESTQTDSGAAASSEASDSTAGSNVFNDGTWRETGKELGGAFKGLGQNIIKSAKRGGDKAGEWAEGGSGLEESQAAGENTGADTPSVVSASDMNPDHPQA